MVGKYVFAIIAVAAQLLLAYQIGCRILDRIGAKDRGKSERVVFAVSLGLICLSYSVLLLAAAKLLYAQALAAILIAGLVATARIPRWRPLAWRGLEAGWHWQALGLIIALVAAVNLAAALAPPSFTDSLSYHFAVPKMWLHDHNLARHTMWESFQPLGTEMLYAMALGLGGESAAGLMGAAMAILAAAGVYAFCRAHVKFASALLAAAIFYVTGLTAFESISGDVDISVGLYLTLSLFAIFNWSDDGEPRWMALAAVFAGFACAAKYTAMEISVILAAIVVLIWILTQRRYSLKTILPFAMIPLLLVGPWLIRNYVQTGDPVYPVLTARHSAAEQREVAAVGNYGNGTGWLDLLRVPFRLTWSPLHGNRFDQGTLLGPLYLAFAPVALYGVRDNRKLKLLMLYVLGCGLVWFRLCQASRMLFTAIPATAVLASAGLAYACQRDRRLRLCSIATIVAGIAVGAGAAVAYDLPMLAAAAGRTSRGDFLSEHVAFYPDIAWMNDHLPGEARVYFADYASYFLDRWYVTPLVRGDISGVTAMLRDRKVGYIFCADDPDGHDCEAIQNMGLRFRTLRDRRFGFRYGTEFVKLHTAVLQYIPAGNGGALTYSIGPND